MAASPPARILPTHEPRLFEAAVREVADALAGGELAVIPTETVYGLAARADDPAAVARIFAAKGRPATNPVIVHIVGLEMARACTGAWPDAASVLARAFWPGPLTLVLPRGPLIPDIVTAGGPTVGIRWPSHPFAQAVIRECGFPVAAPSANPSNALSPTSATQARDALGDRVPLIIDGGQCQVGIESTVLDLTCHPARILRPGIVHASAIRAVLGSLADRAGGASSGPLRSPGQLPRHYAPRARLHVLSWADDAGLRRQLSALGCSPGRTRVVAHGCIPSAEGLGGVSVIPHDAEAYARALYAELHRCDREGAGHIVVEAVPDLPEWAAVADRLQRASA